MTTVFARMVVCGHSCLGARIPVADLLATAKRWRTKKRVDPDAPVRAGERKLAGVGGLGL